ARRYFSVSSSRAGINVSGTKRPPYSPNRPLTSGKTCIGHLVGTLTRKDTDGTDEHGTGQGHSHLAARPAVPPAFLPRQSVSSVSFGVKDREQSADDRPPRRWSWRRTRSAGNQASS